MAIINNRVTEDGDVLIIQPEVPIIGLLSLYNFVDTTDGEVQTDYFRKEFRYSTNGGVTYSEWIELSLLNISNVTITKYNQFFIEYRYTRIGNTPEIDLEFDDILVSGTFEELPYPIYNTTNFKKFFQVNDINVFGWALNVLEKLYQTGILPEYVVRNRGNNNLEDEDFIVYFNTITHYFALIVYFARQFRDISQSPLLLEEFLRQKGIELGNITTNEKIDVYNDYLTQFKQRGTSDMMKKATPTNIDGELLRLLRYSDPEEFIMALLRPKETGWCIGYSSPTWPGTGHMINLVKGYEYTEEVVDLDKYPLKNLSYIYVEDNALKISSVLAGNSAGISYIEDETKKIVVSPNLDYEISFMIKTDALDNDLIFAIKGYDSSGNNINFMSAKLGGSSNYFVNSKPLPIVNQYYWVRGILYNKDKTADIDDYCFPEGNNLKFGSEDTRYIVPVILLNNTTISTSDNFWIKDIKIRPLQIPFTQGQLGIHDIVMGYVVNNNPEKSVIELEEFMKNFMINADSFLKVRYTNKVVYFEPSTVSSDGVLSIYNNEKGTYLDFYDQNNTTLIQRVNIYNRVKEGVDLSLYSSIVAGTYTLRLSNTDTLYKTLTEKLIVV